MRPRVSGQRCPPLALLEQAEAQNSLSSRIKISMSSETMRSEDNPFRKCPLQNSTFLVSLFLYVSTFWECNTILAHYQLSWLLATVCDANLRWHPNLTITAFPKTPTSGKSPSSHCSETRSGRLLVSLPRSECASAVRRISIPKDSLWLLSVFPSPGPLTAQTVTCVRGDVADVMAVGPHADGNIKKMLRCWSEAGISEARRRWEVGGWNATGIKIPDQN